jgi:hypothetical protein
MGAQDHGLYAGDGSTQPGQLFSSGGTDRMIVVLVRVIRLEMSSALIAVRSSVAFHWLAWCSPDHAVDLVSQRACMVYQHVVSMCQS